MNKEEQKKTLKRYFKKGWIFFFLFIGTFAIFLFTKAPAYFDSYIYYKDYRFDAHALLFLYRLLIYFSFPLIVSFLECVYKKQNKKFTKNLLENYNIQFCVYAILAGIYSLFGLDKILGVYIFDTADSFLFVTSFVFSIILNKKFPDLFEEEIDK